MSTRRARSRCAASRTAAAAAARTRPHASCCTPPPTDLTAPPACAASPPRLAPVRSAAQTLAAVLDGSALADHAALLQRAARTGSPKEAKGGKEAEGAPPGDEAAAPTALPLSQRGGVDIGEVRMARRAAAPVRCAALRALMRAWASADAVSRERLAAEVLETALLCAISEWDVRLRALELLAALYTTSADQGGGGGGATLPAALADQDAVRRAFGACSDALEDGKFVAVRKASAGALLALVSARPLPAELLASARSAVADAREREKDAHTAPLLAQLSERLDEQSQKL